MYINPFAFSLCLKSPLLYMFIYNIVLSLALLVKKTSGSDQWSPLSLWTASQCQEFNQQLNVSMYNHACFQDLHIKKDYWHNQQDMDVLMLQVGLVLTNHNIILRDNSIVQSSECWCCDSELFSCLQWLGCKGLSGLRFTLLLPKYGSTTQYRYKFSIVAKKFW